MPTVRATAGTWRRPDSPLVAWPRQVPLFHAGDGGVEPVALGGLHRAEIVGREPVRLGHLRVTSVLDQVVGLGDDLLEEVDAFLDRGDGLARGQAVSLAKRQREDGLLVDRLS